eukprot:14974442-Ditylum_brightwellii.AAC.1
MLVVVPGMNTKVSIFRNPVTEIAVSSWRYAFCLRIIIAICCSVIVPSALNGTNIQCCMCG